MATERMKTAAIRGYLEGHIKNFITDSMNEAEGFLSAKDSDEILANFFCYLREEIEASAEPASIDDWIDAHATRPHDRG